MKEISMPSAVRLEATSLAQEAVIVLARDLQIPPNLLVLPISYMTLEDLLETICWANKLLNTGSMTDVKLLMWLTEITKKRMKECK